MNTEEIVLSLVFLIILILFAGWMLYLLISSGWEVTPKTSSIGNSSFTITCPQGQCATNLQSGFKSCPVDDVPVTVDPSQSICNSRFLCDNPLSPFAVQSDGGTSIEGVCEEGVECQCLKTFQCPNYILSVFTTRNGNPYQGTPGQRITFPQESTFITSNGDQTNTPPIQFRDPSVTFCTASTSWLPLSNPGCNFVTGDTMTYSDILLCMGMPSGCSGLNGNPCLQGTLAFLSSNPDLLNSSRINNTQLACVKGEPCPCGEVAIFDKSFGAIVCRRL